MTTFLRSANRLPRPSNPAFFLSRFTASFSTNLQHMSVGEPASRHSASTPNTRIHILGIGNVGRLIAHSLARLEAPLPLTLFFHRPELVDDFLRCGSKIELMTNGVPSQATGFDYEMIQDSVNTQSTIHNLIVCTKTTQTLAPLSAIKHRLTPQSTILFTQNGMGTVEEVSDTIFPDPTTRPNYLVSLVTHGVYNLGSFRSVHAGQGIITIGSVSNGDPSRPLGNQYRYLLEIVLSSPVLSAVEASETELLNVQLEKLIMNAVINPLASIFRVKNGILFQNPKVLALMQGMLREASPVLIAHMAALNPANAADAKSRFGQERLEEIVRNVATLNATNKASMLQDTEAGKKTEIEYINRWIVRRGKQLGMDCPKNRVLSDLVENSTIVQMDELDMYFPAV